MGAYIYRTILILVLLINFSNSYSQCTINDRGTNSQVATNQYPYTVFYRNDPTGAFDYKRDLNDGLDTFRIALREMVKNGKGDVARNALDKIPFKSYDKLFEGAYDPIKDYRMVGWIKKNGDTIWTTGEDVWRKGFSWQMKAKAYVLLCATNLQSNTYFG